MQRKTRIVRTGLLAVGAIALCAGLALAGGHTWKINEAFSNASGTIQFIEAKETGGGAGETATAGHNITSNSKSFTITANVAAPASFKHLLFATPAFAALPGVPTPDYIFPAGSVPFFSTAGDTIRYVALDATFVFGAGVMPTDGVHSLSRPGFTVGCNSPTNYAGVTATINLGCALSGDVDNNASRNADDIAAFVRVKANTLVGGENPACAEYCTGSLAGDIAAFVNDLLM